MKNYFRLLTIRRAVSLEILPFTVLVFTFLLLPIFFIPLPYVSFEFGKMILLTIGVVLSFVLYVIGTLRRGTLSIPRNLVFFSSILLVLAYFLASLFGNVSEASLLGYGFEITTFVTTLIFVLLMYLTIVLANTSTRIRLLYRILLFVSAILAIFHLLRLFVGTELLSFGYFPTLVSNTVGKWNELAVFFGISTVVSLVALDMLRLRAKVRFWFYIVLLLSLAMLIVVNLSLVWYALAALLLVLFIYILTSGVSQTSTLDVVSSGPVETKMRSSKRTISFRALVVMIVAFVFAFSSLGSNLNDLLGDRFGLSNIEVRPSLEATLGIANEVLKEDPLFGVGPNRFAIAWQHHRPDINLTNFWNSSFSHGVSYISNAVIETGIVGSVAWLIFFTMFILLGIRALFARTLDRPTQFLVVSSFFTSIFLWIMHFLYMPNLPILALTFVFTALFISASGQAGVTSLKTFSIFKYPRMSFVAVMTLVFVLVAQVGLGYLVLNKSFSAFYFEKALAIAPSSRENVDESIKSVRRAIDLSASDIYYRAGAELSVIRLQNIITQAGGAQEISDEVRSDFQTTLASAVEASRLAQLLDPENYENWVSVARVYESLTPVGIDLAYENAKSSYDEAIKRSPRNPAIYFALAGLEVSRGDLELAKGNIAKALVLKPNYLDAIFLQSQVDATEGNLWEAAASVEKILSITPDDPNIAFRLGLIKYSLGDYAGAARALEQAIRSVPVYANARYFLGLSYDRLGRRNEAVSQFEEILRTNPNSEEAKLILSNLVSGKAPFAGTAQGQNTRPERREGLPLDEKES